MATTLRVLGAILGLLLLGFSMGLNVGQWQMARAVEHAVTGWREEAQMRNQVAEEALNLVADSKYQISAAKAEAARKLRNVQDGRR